MNLNIPLILFPVVVMTTVMETIIVTAASKIQSVTKLYFNCHQSTTNNEILVSML